MLGTHARASVALVRTCVREHPTPGQIMFKNINSSRIVARERRPRLAVDRRAQCRRLGSGSAGPGSPANAAAGRLARASAIGSLLRSSLSRPAVRNRYNTLARNSVLAWANTVGPWTVAMVNAIVNANVIREQGFRSARGLQRIWRALRRGAHRSGMRAWRELRRAFVQAGRAHPAAGQRSTRGREQRDPRRLQDPARERAWTRVRAPGSDRAARLHRDARAVPDPALATSGRVFSRNRCWCGAALCAVSAVSLSQRSMITTVSGPYASGSSRLRARCGHASRRGGGECDDNVMAGRRLSR